MNPLTLKLRLQKIRSLLGGFLGGANQPDPEALKLAFLVAQEIDLLVGDLNTERPAKQKKQPSFFQRIRNRFY